MVGLPIFLSARHGLFKGQMWRLGRTLSRSDLKEHCTTFSTFTSNHGGTKCKSETALTREDDLEFLLNNKINLAEKNKTRNEWQIKQLNTAVSILIRKTLILSFVYYLDITQSY